MMRIFNRTFHDAGYDWDVAVTKLPGDGEKLARQAVAEGVDVVAVYGGDGSVMEVACGLVGSEVPMAIIPGGTGNVVSIELNIPRDIQAASALAVSPQPGIRRIDVGQIDNTCFVLRAGIGFEAAALEGATREAKERYGIFAYIISGLQALREPQIATYRLTLDGQLVECEGLACLIANTGNFGIPGLSLAANIDIADGLLDVFVIRKANLAALFALANSILGGTRADVNLLHWQAKEIIAESDPVQSVQIDGELYGSSPVTVRVLPQSLKVIVPPGS
jgi:YegS/Rv2252/BmrU family lipid kinase